MLKLFLTNSCNLNCRYCFASSFTKEPFNEFSIQAINRVLDFIKNDNVDEIGLEGGEPFLHSQIDDVLNVLKNCSQLNQIIIFSNGMFDYSKHEILKDNKFKILVNCNSPKILGNDYNNLVENIKTLNKIMPDRFIIGVNLDGYDFDYYYIFKILKIINKQKFRFAFATSVEEKNSIQNPIEYFKKVNIYLDKFYNDCIKSNVIPFPSCNSSPPCSLTSEQKKTLIRLFNKAKEHNAENLPSLFFNKCTPVIDVFPDLTAVRCFGLKELGKIKLENFKSYSELKQYFMNNYDNNKDCYVNSNSKCITCEHKKQNFCKLCLNY